MRPLRKIDGQATAEYVAVVALVGVLLTLAAGLTSGGLGSHVLAGLQRGLCRIAGTGCSRPIVPRADLKPCPIERAERKEQLSETIVVLRVGQSGTLSAVRLSDGRVTVTLAEGDASGGEVGTGLRLGKGSLGGTASAGLSTTWSSGRAWTLPSLDAARRFIAAYGSKTTIAGSFVDGVRSSCSLLCDAIGWHPHAHLPEPDEIFQETGAVATLAASLGVGSAALTAATALGWSARRDGAATWYLQLDATATAQLGLVGLTAGADAAGHAIVAYSIDAQGRPSELRAQLTVEGAAHAGFDADWRGATARAGAGKGGAVELEATLDLHDATSRTAATRMMRALADPAALTELPARIRGLGTAFAQHGQLDRRTYALDATSSGAGVQLALGVEAGLGWERTTKGLRLLSAETRLPGLPFLPRDDCRPA